VVTYYLFYKTVSSQISSSTNKAIRQAIYQEINKYFTKDQTAIRPGKNHPDNSTIQTPQQNREMPRVEEKRIE
jgi:hypothetical protein